jgi:hypothetical protein
MDSNSFVYWLNGFFELSGATTLNEEQVKVIKEHIALVLHKVTPSTVGSPTPPQQTRGPYTFPVYPDPSVPWYKPWEITCVAGDANINMPLSYNPFVDPSRTQVMGTTVNVSEDMVQDLKAFTGVDLNLPTCECHGTGKQEQQSKLTIPPFEVKDSVQPHLCENCVVVCPNVQNKQDHNGRICPLCKVYCKNLDAKDLPIINVKTHLSC